MRRLILATAVLVPLAVGFVVANDGGRPKVQTRRDMLEQVTVRCRHIPADKMAAILGEALSIAGEERIRSRVSTLIDTEANTVTLPFPREHREALAKLIELVDTPSTQFQIDAKVTKTDAAGKEERLSAPQLVIADGQTGTLQIATGEGFLTLEVRPVAQTAAAATPRAE